MIGESPAKELAPGNLALGQIIVSGLTLIERDLLRITALSLTVQAGEIVGLVGDPGSGKSRCLALIGGAIEPTFGVLRLCGAPSSGAQLGAVGTNIGAVGTNITASRTINPDRWLDELSDNAGSPGEATRTRIRSVLEYVGWSELLSRQDDYHGPAGRSVLGLAAALANDSPVILIDEPMKGLTTGHAERVWKILRDTSEAGKAVLISVDRSDLDRVDCDRLYLIENGLITRRGTVRDIREPFLTEGKAGGVDGSPRCSDRDQANGRPETGTG
jgi:ABC-type multidrug transport system ATPase subunit